MKFVYPALLLLASNSLFAMIAPEQSLRPAISQRLAIAGAIYAAYTKDGQRFIAGTASNKNQIYVTDTQVYKTQAVIDLPNTVTNIADVSPDSSHVVTYSPLEMTLWDIATQKSRFLPNGTQNSFGASYDNTGNQLLVSKPNSAFIFDLRSNTIAVKNDAVVAPALCWNAADQNMISVIAGEFGQEQQLFTWDVAANRLNALAKINAERCTNAQWSNDGTVVMMGFVAQLIKYDLKKAALEYYDLEGKTPIKITSKNEGSWPLTVNFMPGERKRVFSGTNMNTIIYCDLEDDSQSFSFKSQAGGSDAIKAVAIDKSGNYLAAGNYGDSGNQSIIQIWDISAIKEAVKQEPTENIKSVCALADIKEELKAKYDIQKDLDAKQAASKREIGMKIVGNKDHNTHCILL